MDLHVIIKGTLRNDRLTVVAGMIDAEQFGTFLENKATLLILKKWGLCPKLWLHP